MKQQDDLFDLIQAMDPNEKGYFKKYAQLHGNSPDSNSLKLFDALNKQDTYDEKKLMQKFKNEKFTRQLAVAKHYLYELILRSLRSYRENYSALSRMNGWMENTEILFAKGLAGQGLKMVAKCKEENAKMDDPVRELEIQYWEKKYVGELMSQHMEEEMESLMQDGYDSAARLQLQFDLRRVYFKLLWIVRKDMSTNGPSRKEQLDPIMTHPALHRPDSELPGFYTRLTYWNSWNIYYFLSGQQEEAFQSMQRILDLWMEFGEIRDQKFDLYMASLNNFAVAAFSCGKLQEVQEQLHYLDSIEPPQMSVKARIFESTILWRMSLGLLAADLNYIRETQQRVEEQLPVYMGRIPNVRVLVIRYGQAISYFFTRQFDKSLKNLNAILDEKKVDLRNDIQCNSRVLNLLVHYELGNEEILEYLARSTRRYLDLNDGYWNYEQAILQSMNRLSKCITADEKKQVFCQLHETLGEMSSTRKEVRQMVNSLDIFSWVEAHAEGRDITEVFLKNARERGGK